MSQPPSWLHAALALGAAGYGAWMFVRNWSKARHVSDTPTSKIRSAAQGYVELCGVLRETAEDGQLQAPLTGTHCLWWHYRIEERRRSGNRESWHLLESGSSSQALRLVDSTAECLVEPEGADVITAHRKVWTGTERHPRGVVRSEGWFGGLLSGRRYRYTEERLHAGDPLYALGEFRSTGAGRGETAAVSDGQVIREWKQDFGALLERFDGDRNGQFDPQEWSNVQTAAVQEAQQRRVQASREPLQHRLAQPAEDRPFVLSTNGQEELVRKFYWKAIGSAALCLVAALMATTELQGLL